MNAILGTSWKTTLIGYAGAVCIVLMPMLQSSEIPGWKDMLLAAVVAVMGRFVKDTSATGSGK